VVLATLLIQLLNDDGLAHARATEEAIFRPLGTGWIRSMTLMPVSNISSLVDCSSKGRS